MSPADVFFYSSVDGYLGCFSFFAIPNKAVLNVWVLVSLVCIRESFLRLGIGKLVCERPDTKYFRFCDSVVSVTTTQLCHDHLETAVDNM